MLATKLKLLPSECNFVASDQLWRDRVFKEVAAARKYPKKWGDIEEVYKDLLKDIPAPSKDDPNNRLPSELQLPPITPIENYIKVPKSTPYPKTTTGLIGWRSAKRDCDLEIYGKTKCLKGNIYKRFNWPLDAI